MCVWEEGIFCCVCLGGVNILQCVCGTSEYSAVCVGGVNILQCVCGRSEYICGKGVNTRFPQGPLYLGIPLHSMEIKKIPPGLEEEMWSHSNKVLPNISHK